MVLQGGAFRSRFGVQKILRRFFSFLPELVGLWKYRILRARLGRQYGFFNYSEPYQGVGVKTVVPDGVFNRREWLMGYTDGVFGQIK